MKFGLKSLNRTGCWGAVLAAVLCLTAVPAGESLANVPEPSLEGGAVISPDAPQDNPTALNLSVSNVEVHPYAGVSVGFDSNIYLTHTDRVEDPFYQASPGLLVQSAKAGSDRFQFAWNSNLIGRFFIQESQANTVQFSTVLGTMFMAKAWDFGLKVGGGRFEDPINTTFADRTPRAVAEGKAKAVYKGLERLSFELGVHGSYIDYHTDNFGTLDRVETEVPLRALYKLSDTTKLYVNSAWNLCEFRTPGLNNYYYIDTRLGFTGEFLDGKVFSVDINGGLAIMRIKNDNGSNPSVRAVHVVFDSYFQYSPNPQTTFGLALYGTPRVNLALSQPIRPVYGARLDLMHKLIENRLVLTASGFYERSDNLPTDSDQTFLSGSLRGQYYFRPWAFVYLNYQYQARQADDTTLDYEDHKIQAGVGATL